MLLPFGRLEAPVGKSRRLEESGLLLAGKWSDDVRILFSGNKAKEYVAAAPANPSANPFLVTYLAAQHDTEIWLAPLAGSRLVVP